MYLRLTALLAALAMTFSLAFVAPASADEVLHRAKIPAGCSIQHEWAMETNSKGERTNTGVLSTEAFCTERSGYYPIVQMLKAERCNIQILGRGACLNWINWPSQVVTPVDLPMESDVRKMRIKNLTALSWQYGVRQTVTFYKAKNTLDRTHLHPHPKHNFFGVGLNDKNLIGRDTIRK